MMKVDGVKTWPTETLWRLLLDGIPHLFLGIFEGTTAKCVRSHGTTLLLRIRVFRVIHEVMNT